MTKAKTIQEYIDLFMSGKRLTEIVVSEEVKDNLISYVEENKDKTNDILCLYATWLLNGIFFEKNQETAIQLFMQLADQGHVKAQFAVGSLYALGQGVAQDDSQAVYWYQKAADQGYVEAQCNLGVCYATGQGVTQDYKEASIWYRKAADQGYAQAQCNLGICYEAGQGVAQDDSQAVYWYQKAAKQGNARAQCNLGYFYSKGQGVAQDDSQAVYWYQKAADQGYVEAQCNLGVCYATGQGVTQDYKEASIWYRKAADQGYVGAQCNLGICYALGQGVAQDDKEAVFWFGKAADQGFAKAQCILGICYRGGQGVAQDYNQSLFYLEKAAEQKYIPAYEQLSSLYAVSTTVFFDLGKSMFYEELANGRSIALAYYNVGYRYYLDENISHNKYSRYGKALYYVTKAYDLGLEYAKELKEQLEELYQKVQLTNEKPRNYKELHIGKSKDVFISWNHNDVELKNQYVKFIKDHGFTCWNSDVDCHGDIRKACIEGVLDSSLFIVVISGNTLESDYVALELNTMLDRISSINDWKNYIKPIYVNRYTTKKGKVKKFDVSMQINQIAKKDSNNPFVRLWKSDIGVSTNVEGILDFIEESIKKLKFKEYKETYLSLMSEFEGALQNTILSNQMYSGAFSTTFKLEDAYIEQPLFKDDIKVNYKDIIESNQPILIYGEGGIGKSLYLKNLSRISFKGNSFFFFLSSKDVVREENENFYNVLYRNFESRMRRSINIDCIKQLLENSHNDIYVILDALDEVSDEEKIKLLKLIYPFSTQYKGIHYIFSSRSSEDGNLISSILHQETLTYTLKGMTEEDISKLYDHILQKANCAQNKNEFLKVLGTIDTSIKKNPMVISNLIIIYLMSGKLPSKFYEIIQSMVNIVFENQERDSDASFKYKDYFNADELRSILEFIAYMRSKNVKLSSIELLNIFYSKYSFFKEDLKEDKLVAKNVNEYLKRRCILIQGNINHQMYNDYFASSYCYNHAYKQENNEQSIYLLPLENGVNINQMIENITSYGEQWYNVIIYFILQVDYVCNMLGENIKENDVILKAIVNICFNHVQIRKLMIQYLENNQFYHFKLLENEMKLN